MKGDHYIAALCVALIIFAGIALTLSALHFKRGLPDGEDTESYFSRPYGYW